MPLSANDVKPLGGLKVLSVTRGITIGMLGNVVLTVWPDVASAEELDELLHFGPRMIGACTGRIGYMALVESTVRPPNLAGRRQDRRGTRSLRAARHQVLDGAPRRRGPPGISCAIAVTMGTTHACALDSGRRAHCWGDDTYGQATPPVR